MKVVLKISTIVDAKMFHLLLGGRNKIETWLLCFLDDYMQLKASKAYRAISGAFIFFDATNPTNETK